jgi:hypothetical protein
MSKDNAQCTDVPTYSSREELARELYRFFANRESDDPDPSGPGGAKMPVSPARKGNQPPIRPVHLDAPKPNSPLDYPDNTAVRSVAMLVGTTFLSPPATRFITGKPAKGGFVKLDCLVQTMKGVVYLPLWWDGPVANRVDWAGHTFGLHVPPIAACRIALRFLDWSSGVNCRPAGNENWPVRERWRRTA